MNSVKILLLIFQLIPCFLWAQTIEYKKYSKVYKSRDEIKLEQLVPDFSAYDIGLLFIGNSLALQRFSAKYPEDLRNDCQQKIAVITVEANPSDEATKFDPKLKTNSKDFGSIPISDAVYILYVKNPQSLNAIMISGMANGHFVYDIGNQFYYLRKNDEECSKDRSLNFWELVKTITNEAFQVNCDVLEKLKKEKQEEAIISLLTKVERLESLMDSIRNLPPKKEDNNNFIESNYSMGFGQSIYPFWKEYGADVRSNSTSGTLNIGYVRRTVRQNLFEVNFMISSGAVRFITDSIETSRFKLDAQGDYYKYIERYHALNERLTYRAIGFGASYLHRFGMRTFNKAGSPLFYVGGGITLYSLGDLTYSASTESYTTSAKFNSLSTEVTNIPDLGLVQNGQLEIANTTLVASRVVVYPFMKLRLERRLFGLSEVAMTFDLQYQFGSNLLSRVNLPEDRVFGRFHTFFLHPFAFGFGLKYQL